MTPHDHFRSFASLARVTKHAHYAIFTEPRQTAIVVIAPHGGGIEPGTSEVAKALAGRTLSIYCFEGLKGSRNRMLHITSTRFDEPQCLTMVHQSRVVVTVHGSDDRGSTVLIGGRHAELRRRILAALRQAGFKAEVAYTNLAGASSRNLCNTGQSRRGIQIELPNGLRHRMFSGLSRKLRTETTATFSAFIAAVRPVFADKL